ncbi:hypothetical protein KIW84_072049 [Lathyrus oleraceus]|uniref:Uncharacterized protein n=1 Tax=Pisum sativum TaxID=3888 RepID=A0A9D4VKP1_PEA|nr:hypothetical protein KIW84_072049 [Pisum sativum]
MVDFENLKADAFYVFGTLRSQGWEGFFDCLKGPVYDQLVKQLWVFAKASKFQVTSYVLGHKISISEKSIATLLGHDGSGKKCFNRTTVGSRSMSVDEFPLFSQEESKEVMKHYNDECLKKGHPREVLVFKDLPKTHKDMYSLKRRHRSITFGEGPSEFVRTPTKVARISELIILKDTMGPEVEHVRF